MDGIILDIAGRCAYASVFYVEAGSFVAEKRKLDSGTRD